MNLVTRRSLTWAIVVTASVGLAGCSTGPFRHLRSDDDCNSCQAEPGSKEWWSQKAMLPVGARQRYHKGKLWPPKPRPTDEHQQLSHIYHAAHYWPLPYVCQDRAYVNNLLMQQAAQGWTAATTVYEYHFLEDENGVELTEPGRKHLFWILKTVPAERRTVFVQETMDPDLSQQRLQAVEVAAAEMCRSSEMPPIMLRVTDTIGRPALEVDAIRRSEISTLPAPRLPSGLGSAESSGAAP